MSKTIKIAALLMILAVPVFIFLFLRTFGTNEFTIPVYYEGGLPSDTLGCTYDQAGQYYTKLPEANGGTAVVLLDGGDTLLSTADRNNLLNRIRANSETETVLIVYFNRDAGAPVPAEKIKYVPQSGDSWVSLQCRLVTQQDRQLILLDKQGRIRGYYELDLEEVDRLLVELEILNL